MTTFLAKGSLQIFVLFYLFKSKSWQKYTATTSKELNVLGHVLNLNQSDFP